MLVICVSLVSLSIKDFIVIYCHSFILYSIRLREDRPDRESVVSTVIPLVLGNQSSSRPKRRSICGLLDYYRHAQAHASRSTLKAQAQLIPLDLQPERSTRHIAQLIPSDLQPERSTRRIRNT